MRSIYKLALYYTSRKKSRTIILLLLILSGCGLEKRQSMTEESPNKAEKRIEEIKDYGQKIKVKDKFMNVYTVGTGDRAIVLLPGLGEFSQVYSHHNLIKGLSNTYNVAVIEPFGYGLSDIIDEPRIIDNITDEIHEAIQ